MQSPDGQVFFMSWYLDACYPEWSALIRGDYQSIFPLASRKKMGVSYLFQPFFTRHFGMIGTSGFNPETGQEFLNAIPDRFKYIDLCLHHRHKVAEGFKTTLKTYQTLDLKLVDLSTRYSENLQRLLKKANHAGLNLVHGIAPEHIVASFQLNQTKITDQFSRKDFTCLTNLMYSAQSHSDSHCVAVHDPNGQALAGAFFIGFKDTLLYLKGYSTELGRKLGAMHFLFDRIIHANRDKYSTFDFGGSSVPGVARFYRHFGATDSLYLRIRSNRLPKALRWIKNEKS